MSFIDYESHNPTSDGDLRANVYKGEESKQVDNLQFEYLTVQTTAWRATVIADDLARFTQNGCKA